MTAAQAVKAECKLCSNTKLFHGCASAICELNAKHKSTVRMIKAHCLTCIPAGSHHAVKECDGRVYSKGLVAFCNLHPFRLGKNPNRKKKHLTEEQKARLRINLVKIRGTSIAL